MRCFTEPKALTAVCCRVSYSRRFSSSATAQATRASRRAAWVRVRELTLNRLVVSLPAASSASETSCGSPPRKLRRIAPTTLESATLHKPPRGRIASAVDEGAQSTYPWDDPAHGPWAGSLRAASEGSPAVLVLLEDQPALPVLLGLDLTARVPLGEHLL